MATVDNAGSRLPVARKQGRGRRLRGVLLLLLGALAILSVFYAGTLALLLVGGLLIACGALEMLETFRASSEARRRSAYLSGALSILAGMLLLARPQLLLRGLALFVAAFFLIDGLGKLFAAHRVRAAGGAWKWMLLSALINVALAVALAAQWPISGTSVVVVLVAARILTAGWSMLLDREALQTPVTEPLSTSFHPDRRLGLPPSSVFAELAESMKAEETRRRWVDAGWCWTMVVVFFAIHIGRMHVTWNVVGLISPLVAAVGDVGTALVLAFALVLPVRLAWRRLTRPLERRGWDRLLVRKEQGRGPGLWGRLYRGWLLARLRFSRTMVRSRRSPLAALGWGLRVGLPLTAILVAVNPIWGFSWFFNSESWTTGIWDRWAEARTDIWREEMIHSIAAHYQARGVPGEHLFEVKPEGVNSSADFSFLVLGDTGEGGLAQHSLRDQYLFLGQRPEVKFLVISSDVIYPEGAIEDYEPYFYLPFKGFTKPIYALPGNHDWYDALEAFAANFFEPDAARAAMHARMSVDGWWTTTTPHQIEGKIQKAARLRQEFGVSTGWQRGPFFEVQTESFALIAVDTGVVRRVDTDQWNWLKAALERAQGKFTLVILGHPLYAGGRYQGGNDAPFAGEWADQDRPVEVAGHRLRAETAPFAAIHQILREHQVDVVMAGDTHYFEHYREHYENGGQKRTMNHFVNGGGGAYMSIGTPLDWPDQPATADAAYYPRKDFLVDKLNREMPVWKEPLWWWVKYFRAWPLTSEAMAGAFRYDRAPFLQSFVEVRVENSQGRVRLIPYGANGPLRWRELETFGALVPVGSARDELVEFAFPISRPHR